jgi:glyoxylase-like metal-dependent hydrolase (beta-lactamase superfamily II)
LSPSLQFGPVSIYLGEKSGKYPDGNQLLVRGGDTLAAFDTPLVANRIPELRAAELVILGHVHEDHIAGLHLLPRARVLAPQGDLEALRSWDGLARHYGYAPQALAAMKTKIEREFHYVARPDAEGYGDGAAWDLGGGVTVRALHMPGHTSGHSVLLVEPGGVAFIGDIDLSSFGPYYGDATSSLEAFRRTLRAVAQVPARVWITSHHKGAITERAAFLALLEAFAAKLEAREQAIAAHLGEAGPRTLEELAAHRFMYPRGHLDVFVEDAERRTIVQHLASLAAAGRVREEAGRYRLAA